jgi:TusA-related sulfurtransferase
MVEMQMESERVERLRLQQLGEDWIRAIMEGALERLEDFCQPDILSQVLTPYRYMNFNNPKNLIARYHQWFGECSDFHLEQSRVEIVGERLGIFYRFLLQEQGDWYAVEQQLFGTMKDGRMARLHLLCSGFQPVAAGGLANEPEAGEVSPAPELLLELHTGAADSASTCAILTPAIKSRLREMQSGQVLEVRVDDPSAKEDIEAWSRLSGNPLVGMSNGEGPELRFFVKKK